MNGPTPILGLDGKPVNPGVEHLAAQQIQREMFEAAARGAVDPLLADMREQLDHHRQQIVGLLFLVETQARLIRTLTDAVDDKPEALVELAWTSQKRAERWALMCLPRKPMLFRDGQPSLTALGEPVVGAAYQDMGDSAQATIIVAAQLPPEIAALDGKVYEVEGKKKLGEVLRMAQAATQEALETMWEREGQDIAPEPEKMPEHVKAAMQDVIDKVSSQDQDPEEAAPAREAGGLSEVGGGVKGDRDG